MAHGHLTSHNVFVEFDDCEVGSYETAKVTLDGIEMSDLKKYANMFNDYRNVSVWSPPEVLKHPKKLLEPLTQHDVYSFGVIMWEVLHEMVPFDGKLRDCTDLVIKQDLRPAINVDGEYDSSAMVESKQKEVCSQTLANLISSCWASDPNERPSLEVVIEELTQEVSFFKTSKFGGRNEQFMLETEYHIEPFV